MYYEPYKRRERRRRGRRERRAAGGCLGALLARLLAAALALALIVAGLLYALPPSTFSVEPEGGELSLTDGLPSGRVNILLLGTDLLRENSQRSHSVIIASIGYGALKLTSVLRDTLVDIPGHGSAKLNAAYAYGGPELVMRTLNENFRLNIMHYIAVDFVSLVEIVDAMGGVELDITPAEMEQININVVSARKVFAPLGYTATELTRSGEGIHLDGMQALGYARIRKIDSDFQRAGRQRTLLEAMLKKLRGNLWNPLVMVRLARAVLNATQTNMSVVQLLSLGEKALAAGVPEQTRLPVEGSYSDDGSSLRITDRQMNIDAFRAFAYE